MADGEYWQHPSTFTDEYPWLKRARPGFKRELHPAEGQSYLELTAKHGRPIGPFENGRELQYGKTQRGGMLWRYTISYFGRSLLLPSPAANTNN
jgi:hypothetical protein